MKEYQPVKLAAMEGLWETTRGAPLLLFAIPDMEAQDNHHEVGIPKLGSLILAHDLNGEITGLEAFPPELWPNVPVVFWSFRLMVGIGLLFVAVAAYGMVQRWRRRLYEDRWLHRACIAVAPLGFVATISGWITAEVGRQPFTVHGLLTTMESISPISRIEVATSLVAFVVVYGALFAAYLFYLAKLVRRGANLDEALPERLAEHARTPRTAVAAPSS